MSKKQLSKYILEGLELLWINLKVSWKSFIEFIKVASKYYRNASFAKADTALLLMYLFDNPYRISKRFLMKQKAENIYTYGETPLTTLDMIAKTCDIKEEDHVFELGCGRGRTCFWLHCIKGCHVTGIDQVTDFIVRAQRVQRKLKYKGLTFVEGDFLESSLEGATVIYLYGTTLEDDDIKRLIDHFRKLPSGTKFITVSYPLTAYTDSKDIVVMKRFTAPFTWGDADVFLHVKS